MTSGFWKDNSPSWLFVCRVALAIFVVSCGFWDVKNVAGILLETVLSLYLAFGRVLIFTILNLFGQYAWGAFLFSGISVFLKRIKNFSM